MKAIEGLTESESRALELFRALGNPARLRIVAELARRDACATGDIVDVLPLAQSTISEHLKVLKESGIVRGTVENDLCFCLDPETVDWLVAFCRELAEACCGAPTSPR